MSTDIVGADEKKRLAQHLRNKAVGGAALSVTDLDEISQQGRGMQQQAQTMARDIGLQQARAEREMTDRARLSRAVQQSNQYKIFFRLLSSSINVNGVTHRLESVKRDSYG